MKDDKCPSCLYSIPAKKDTEKAEKGAIPQGFYDADQAEKSDGDCPSCLYTPVNKEEK